MTRRDRTILKTIVKQEGDCFIPVHDGHILSCFECPLEDDCGGVVVRSNIPERRLESACKMLADFEVEKLLKGKR